MTLRMLGVLLVLAGAALLAATPAAMAQPATAQWQGLGPGYWDDPLMWAWPGGAPTPEGYPHDTWGGLYDCRLLSVGDMAVVANDVGVFDVMVGQDLKLIDDATLTLTATVADPLLPAPPWPTAWPHRYPLAIRSDGVVRGKGEVRALGAGIIGTILADGIDDDLTFTVDEIFLDGAGGGNMTARNYGVLTVQSVGIEANGSALIEATGMGDLGLSGWVHGDATITAHDTGFLTLDTAWIDMPANTLTVDTFSAATVRDSVVHADVIVREGSTMDVYNSTFYDDMMLTGGTVQVAGNAMSQLSIAQGYCHIADLQVDDNCTLLVDSAAHLEVDHMDLGTGALCQVYGIIETNTPTSWNGPDSYVVLAGGEIRGGFVSNVPLAGYGTIATSAPGPMFPGLTQQAGIIAEGGVLELAPGAFLAHEAWAQWPPLQVRGGAEFFINDAQYLNYEGTIGVEQAGILRLHDATIAGWGEIHLGSMPVMAGPQAQGHGEPGGPQLIATGDNECQYSLFLWQPDAEASILFGETQIPGLVNYGEVWVAPGAELEVDDEVFGGALMFDNYGYTEVEGMLWVAISEEATGINEGVIEINGQGVAHLSGRLDGHGDIVVEDNGVFHPHDASYWGGGVGQTIRMAGGTLCGSLMTDHAVEGYGTITGSHTVISGGITANVFGEMLHITDAYVQLVGEEMSGDLVASGGAILKIEDAGIMPGTSMEPLMAGDGPASANAFAGDAPEFWVRGPAGGMPEPGHEDDLTIAIIRDSTVTLPAHVEAGGLLLTHGDVEMFGVDVHNDGDMQVCGDANMCYLGVGTRHPETEEAGGGEVLIAPGATLSVQAVGVFDGAQGGPGVVRVEGELHFRPCLLSEGMMGPTCSIQGGGLVDLAGGLISGEAPVQHDMPRSIHGHGRIAAALVNWGAVSADTGGAWLRLDTNDKENHGLIEATNEGRIALDEIRLDNYGSVDIGDFSTLLVDASILECHDAGTLTVGFDAMVELRRGGSIVGCGGGPMATAPGSQVLVGACGQAAPPDVAYNEFALPAMDHAGTLTVFNPAATGQAAPDTGDTILTVGGDLATSGQVNVGLGSTMILAGQYTQSAGGTVIEGLMVADGGRVRIDDGVFAIDALAGGALDLMTNNLIVDYDAASPYGQIEDWVTQGFNGGLWNSTGTAVGITTADGNPVDYALAIVDNSDPDGGGMADLEGEPVDATSVLVKYTFYADADLNGQLDAADVNRLVLSFGGLLADPTARWASCDYNYDNLVDAADVNLLVLAFASHAGKTLAGGDPVPVGGSAVPTPEPATLALLGLGAAAMIARRRRTR